MHKGITHRCRTIWPEEHLCRTQQMALHQLLAARLNVHDVVFQGCGYGRHGKRDPSHTGRL